MGVASLILGIVALLVALFGTLLGGGWLAAILGFIGIMLGAATQKNGQSGMATAGLVLSIIALVWGLLSWIVCAACLAGTAGYL